MELDDRTGARERPHVSVGYVGSESYHTPLILNANSPYPIVCQEPQGCISGGVAQNGNPIPVSQRVVVPKGTLYHPPSTRPNPNVGNGPQWFIQGTANYHGLDV